MALSRGDMGLSLRAAGVRAGTSHVYLLEVESGRKLCSAEKALALADAYGGSLHEAARLWTLDRIEVIEREATEAGRKHRMSIVYESHRLAAGAR